MALGHKLTGVDASCLVTQRLGEPRAMMQAREFRLHETHRTEGLWMDMLSLHALMGEQVNLYTPTSKESGAVYIGRW